MPNIDLARRRLVVRASNFAIAVALGSSACSRQEADDANSNAAVEADPGTASKAAKASEVFDTATAATLLSVVQTIYPHPNVDTELYGVALDALKGAASQPAVANLLTDGIKDLTQRAGAAWPALSPEKRTELLRQIEPTPFFQTLRATTVFTFYNQPKIWEAFGYEGDAWAKGGYLARGLNDIDWLSEPKAIAP
jgi:hypothetical protein